MVLQKKDMIHQQYEIWHLLYLASVIRNEELGYRLDVELDSIFSTTRGITRLFEIFH